MDKGLIHQKTLKRNSGSKLFNKYIPQAQPRKIFSKVVRYSKLEKETLPKIDTHKSYASVPTTLELFINKDKRRESKELSITK